MITEYPPYCSYPSLVYDVTGVDGKVRRVSIAQPLDRDFQTECIKKGESFEFIDERLPTCEGPGNPPTEPETPDEIPPAELKAIPSATPNEGVHPLTVILDGTGSLGEIVSYEWSLGLGIGNIIGDEANIDYLIDIAGETIFMLKVTDAEGNSDEAAVSVTTT